MFPEVAFEIDQFQRRLSQGRIGNSLADSDIAGGDKPALSPQRIARNREESAYFTPLDIGALSVRAQLPGLALDRYEFSVVGALGDNINADIAAVPEISLAVRPVIPKPAFAFVDIPLRNQRCRLNRQGLQPLAVGRLSALCLDFLQDF